MTRLWPKFYTPQSGSRSAAAWGRAACLSGPRPSSPPSYIQHHHPGSQRLSLGFWWRTAPLLTSSLPASPAVDEGTTGQRSQWNKENLKLILTIRPFLVAIFKALHISGLALTLPKLPLPSRARKLKSLSRTRSMLLEGRLNRRWSDGVITFLPWPSLAFCGIKVKSILKILIYLLLWLSCNFMYIVWWSSINK